ncbi:MAG: glycosyltransferase [Candidatus Korobacteraceae bacterium]
MFFGVEASFVVAVSNRSVLESNFLLSPCLPSTGDFIFQEGASSAAVAYNDGLRHAKNDLVIFLHQDVYLPAGWLQNLSSALDQLTDIDPSWGVLGCWGVDPDGKGTGHLYSNGLGIIGQRFSRPARVRTLDEIVLILRRSAGLSFDSALPGFHLYGTDICLQAASAGRNCYVIPGFCVHNTMGGLVLPKEFYTSYWYVRNKWKKLLPITTPCIRISRWNGSLFERRARELKLVLEGRGGKRTPQPIASILAAVPIENVNPA